MDLNNYQAFFDENIKLIKQALNEQYLSIFAGAGVSFLSRLPSWSSLMLKISRTLYGNKVCNKKYLEDYLILAEKFYNAYGKNKYYQKLKELTYYDSAKPNDLHRSIVRLDIKNLITTNWDNLFEKAIEEEGLFYNIIRKDEDIGYSSGFSKFIKMHGSFEDQNIVFREKDYLEYSSNFPLIENYLKGVFSTDCVVLMGYSLSDNNVKQIINWVNCKATNIKPVYFIKTDKSYDYYEFDFYKNKNIHILYLRDTIGEKNTKIKNDQTKLLQEFLSYITSDKQTYYKDIDLVKDKSKFEYEFSQFLNRYNDCRFITSDLLMQDIYKYFPITYSDMYYRDYIIWINNSNLKNLKKGIYKKISKLTLSIIIFKNGVDSFISEKDINRTFDINMTFFLRSLICFDYETIEKLIKNINFYKKDSNQNRLIRAFLLYKNKHFIESYEELKFISNRAFKEKDYISWYISETNKEYFSFSTNSEEQFEEISSYLNRDKENRIDLEDRYLKLPLSKRDILRGVRNIDSFLSNLEKYSLYLKNKAIEKFFNIEKGGISFDNNIPYAKHIIQYGLNFEINLFILEKLEPVYRNTIEALLINYSAQFNKKDGKAVEFTIENFIISMAILYLKEDKLKKIFTYYFGKKNIIFKYENKNFLKRVFENICKNFKELSIIQTQYSSLFNNFLVFSAWLSLDQDFFDFIIEKFTEKLKNNLLNTDEFQSMDYFLTGQYQRNNLKNLDKTREIIYSYIDLFIINRSNIMHILALNYTSIVTNLVFILKKDHIKLDGNIILKCINSLSLKHILDQSIFFKLFLLDLYEICDENIQSELNKFASKIYVNLKDYVSKSLPQKDSKETSEQRSTNPVPIEEYILAMLEIGFFLYKRGESINFDKEDYVKQFNHIKSTSKSSNKNSNTQDLFQNFRVLDFITDHEKYIDHK